MDKRARQNNLCARNKALYHVWYNMRERCFNPRSAAAAKSYAERGIAVCAEWSDFPSFLSWAHGAGYHAGLTIDRIDNDGNYGPENCRWATPKEQGKNKRNNIWIEHAGQRRTLCEWAELAGLPTRRLWQRLYKNGWRFDRAIAAPLKVIQ